MGCIIIYLRSIFNKQIGIHHSLNDSYKTISIPKNVSFFRKLLAFTGPGYMIAVGYMDPGNWATDLAGGSSFGYKLLFIVLISNLFAIVLQHLSAKLGIATGRDLAQMCKDKFPRFVNVFLWFMAEIMIVACDLAEVIGSAIAIKLLFGIPLLIGVVITGFDVLVLLLLQQKGYRYLEAIVMVLIGTIILCFGIEIIIAQPQLLPLLQGFIPTKELFTNAEMLYISVGILGATVMPHNLYLHSSIVQTRNFSESKSGIKEAIYFSTIDSTFALLLAFFVNASILILSASTFHTRGYEQVAEIEQAYKLLSPLLGVVGASTLFAVALLASGQTSTITATLAGQIIMEGFLNLRMKPWMRRLLTRSLAVIPAILVILLYGDLGLSKLLISSQVVLSLQLSFAVFPLVYFTSNKHIMKGFENKKWLQYTAYIIAIIIVCLNIWLVQNIFSG